MRPSARNLRVLLLSCLCLLLFSACTARKPTSTADVPRLLSPAYSVAVVPFHQPTNTSQLITGFLPSPQGKITPAELASLDNQLQQALESKKSARKYTFMASTDPRLPALQRGHGSNMPQALPHWAETARKSGADFLLVPQVLNWHQREGSRAGVSRAAHVRIEMFLINAKNGTVSQRSIFEEEQTGLTDNLLNINDFFRRKGGWVTAEELSQEAILTAIKDFGL